MSRLTSLVKTNINNSFGISLLKYRFTKEKKKRWEPFMIALGIIVGFGSLIVVYTFFIQMLYEAGNSVGQPEIVITMAFLAAQLLVFIFGIFYVMSAFYFSRDLNILVPLPIKPWEVLAGKMSVVIINEYITLLPLLLPALIIYSVGTGQHAFFWLKGIILILVSPVIPLVIAAIFVVIIMRFINLRKSKDLFAIIGGFFAIFFALGINLLIQNIAGNKKENFMDVLLSQSGLMNEIGRKFPPSIWATIGLAQPGINGFLNFLLFIAVSVMLFFLLMWLGNMIFYKGVLSGQEASAKKRIYTDAEAQKKIEKTSSPLMAIFVREWKLLLRTPVYALNGLAGIFMGPLFSIILIFSKGSGGKNTDFLKLIGQPQYIMYFTFGVIAYLLFVSGMNLAAATALSREGTTFWISKMIPVTAETQVMGKFLNGLSISLIGTTVTGVMAGFLFGLTPVRAILAVVLGLIGSVFPVALNLIIDVYHPKMVWNNPAEAMKQNLNGMLGILVSVIAIGIYAALVYLMLTLGMQEWLIYTLLAILMAVLGAAGVKGLIALAGWSYRKIEV